MADVFRWAGPLVGVPIEARPFGREALIVGRASPAPAFTGDEVRSLTTCAVTASLLLLAADRPAGAAVDPLADLGDDRLWDMLESAPDAMLMTDADGLLTVVNRQAETLFGYDRSELLGRPVELLLPERYRDAHVAHRERYGAKPGNRPMGVGLDLWALRADGSEFPVEISLSPARRPGDRGHVIAAVRDITTRSETEARLREAQIRFRGAFDDGPVPMALVDITAPAERVIIEANQAMADLLGYERRRLLGMPFGDLTHPDDRARDEEAATGHACGDYARYSPVKRYVRADGSIVWVQLYASPLMRRAGGVICIAHAIDITEQVRATEIAERHEALDHAVSEIRLAMLRGASREQGLALIARKAAESLEADTTLILLPAGDGDRLVTAASHNLSEREKAQLEFTTGEGVLGEVFSSGRAQICGPDDLRCEAGTNRAVVEARSVKSIVVAPIHDGDGPIGILLVVRTGGTAPLVSDDLTHIERFASEAVVAIELADVAEAHQRLELLEDRERIGRDMHDKVIGRLFATGMSLQAMATLLDGDGRERALTAVAEIDASIQEIRAAIYGIRSQVDWGKGVRGEILAVAAGQRTALGFEPQIDLDGDFDELPQDVVDDLLATIREALSNAAKYAEATDVRISVAVAAGMVDLTVTDNGIGFEATTDTDEPDAHLVSHGLDNMVARAERLGGRTDISSSPLQGTTVRWRVPIERT